MDQAENWVKETARKYKTLPTEILVIIVAYLNSDDAGRDNIRELFELKHEDPHNPLSQIEANIFDGLISLEAAIGATGKKHDFGMRRFKKLLMDELSERFEKDPKHPVVEMLISILREQLNPEE